MAGSKDKEVHFVIFLVLNLASRNFYVDSNNPITSRIAFMDDPETRISDMT